MNPIAIGGNKMRCVLTVLLTLLLGQSSIAGTTREQAIQCFNDGLKQAKTTDSNYLELLSKAISVPDLINLSIKYANVDAKRYSQLTTADRRRFEELVQNFTGADSDKSFTKIGFKIIDFETFEVSESNGRVISNSYILAGTFKLISGGGHRFRMRWVRIKDKCYLVDGSWKGILLSFVIGVKF